MTPRLSRLRALLRRVFARTIVERRAPCAHDRETLDLWGGYALRWRCLDCGETRMAGWVFTGVSNRKPLRREGTRGVTW